VVYRYSNGEQTLPGFEWQWRNSSYDVFANPLSFTTQLMSWRQPEPFLFVSDDTGWVASNVDPQGNFSLRIGVVVDLK